MLPSVSGETIRLMIDVSVDGDSISGRAGDGLGENRPFSGWLGLIGALDELVDASTRRSPDQVVHLCVGFGSARDATAFTTSATLREAILGAAADGTPEIRFAPRAVPPEPDPR